MQYDVIIIGGGAAGFSAGIYTSRRLLKTLILSKDIGGQTALTTEIENYPGVDFADGTELMMKFKAQAEKFGCEFGIDEVVGIKKDEEGFLVMTATGKEYATRAVILAFGMSPKNLDVPGESKFVGRGVSYCATCDAPLYKGKTVAVIGGGNSALDATEYLSRLATKVYLVHRRNEFRGDEILEARVRALKNVELVFESVVTEVLGDDRVQGVRVSHVTTNEQHQITCDGVFVAIGHVVKARWLGDLVDYDAIGHIHANELGETKTPGLFAAGDVVSGSFKQIATASGEGVRAALRCYQYLTKTTGRLLAPDWDIKKK